MRATLAACCLALASMPVLADTHAVRIQVDAHSVAEVTRLGEDRIRVTLVPDDTVQVLDELITDAEGNFRIGTDDYDFDGHPDIAVLATMGQVNESAVVYLFDPAQRRFVRLAEPEPGEVPFSCDGFWSLQPDPARRTLTSSCRSGPMWYTDVYRYDEAGALYVYQSQRRLLMGAIEDMLTREEDDGIPLSVWSTYTPQGRVVSRAIASEPDAPPRQGRVAVARLPLYPGPRASSTRRYLIEGDPFEALDASEDEQWLQVRYRNPAKGAVTGWVRVDAATPG